MGCIIVLILSVISPCLLLTSSSRIAWLMIAMLEGCCMQSSWWGVNDSSTKVLFKGMNSGVVFGVECTSFWSKELVRARGLKHEVGSRSQRHCAVL